MKRLEIKEKSPMEDRRPESIEWRTNIDPRM